MILTVPQIYEQQFWYIERYALDRSDQENLGLSQIMPCLQGSIQKIAGVSPFFSGLQAIPGTQKSNCPLNYVH